MPVTPLPITPVTSAFQDRLVPERLSANPTVTDFSMGDELCHLKRLQGDFALFCIEKRAYNVEYMVHGLYSIDQSQL